MPVPPPDPYTVANVGLMLGLAHLTKDAVTDIVKRICGPTADNVGSALAGFFEKRTQRATGVLEYGAHMLMDAGLEPQPVPGRILIPILEHCSWEDDPDLQRRWAALLANAASPHMANKIIPAFAEILRQLTPVQARIVQWMFDQKTEGLPGHWPDVSRTDIEGTFQLKSSEYALLVSDLERLQIIEPRRDLDVPFPAPDVVDMDALVPLIIGRWNSRVKYDSIGFTSLGVQFVAACTPPRNT